MINRDLLYYDSFETFNSLKLSANQFNTRYTIGVSGEEQDGEPLIAWKTAVFIAAPHLMIWLRGKLWDIEAYNAYGIRYSLEESVGDALDRLINQLTNKQDKLVSGENIKTVNGHSLLGTGNVTIPTLTAYEKQQLQEQIADNASKIHDNAVNIIKVEGKFNELNDGIEASKAEVEKALEEVTSMAYDAKLSAEESGSNLAAVKDALDNLNAQGDAGLAPQVLQNTGDIAENTAAIENLRKMPSVALELDDEGELMLTIGEHSVVTGGSVDEDGEVTLNINIL